MRIDDKININKKELKSYLSDFTKHLRHEYLKLITEDDLKKGTNSFYRYIRKVISMPVIGKSTLRYWTSRGWSDEEAELKRIKLKKDPTKSPMNVNFWINKGMSLEDAEYKIKTFRKFNIEYWVSRGYSEVDAKNEIRKFQKNANSKVDHKSIINSTKIEYWINKGYNKKEAAKKLSERQSTFSLKKCIEKHGRNSGMEIWKNRQDRWKKSLLENGNLKMGFSKISQELFGLLTTKIDSNNVRYATLNTEYSIQVDDRLYLYDFTCLDTKRIIEFNGDVYHANPSLFLESDRPHPFKELTAKELWILDDIKNDIAKANGFEVLVIWESEYKKNKKEILNKCVEFLYNSK
jgi:very-short-patch-repair endonuclease